MATVSALNCCCRPGLFRFLVRLSDGLWLPSKLVDWAGSVAPDPVRAGRRCGLDGGSGGRGVWSGE